MSSSAASKVKRDLDWIVVQYLHKNQCFQAEKAFLKHLAEKHGVDVVPPKLVMQDDYLKYMVMSKLLPETMEGELNYTKCFQELEAYIASLLDVYKLDLKRLLYPIFMYCVLELLYQGKVGSCQEFFEVCRPIVDVHDLPERRLELDQISRLRTLKEVDHNPVAKKYWCSRAVLDLSEQSFDLVTRFLHDKELHAILGILHKCIDVRTYPGFPRKDRFGEAVIEHTISVDVENATLSTNLEEIKTGLLPDILEEKVVVQDTSENKKVKKTKASFIDNVKRIKAWIPMRAVDSKVQEPVIEDIKVRKRITDSELPSICCATFVNTHQMMTSCAVLANEKEIAAGFSDSSLHIYSLSSPKSDTLDGNEIPSKVKELHGHSGPITAISSTVDQQLMLTSSCDSSVRLWGLELGRCIASFRSHKGPVWDVKACPRLPYFASAGWDGSAIVWSTELIKPLRLLAGHTSDVDCVSWHPNGHYVATGSSDCTARLWDVSTGKCVRILTGGHDSKICSIAVSPNGNVAATGDIEGSISIWDLDTAKLYTNFSKHSSPIWSLAFDMNGSILAAGCEDASVSLWDVESHGNSVAALKAYTSRATTMHNVHFTQTNLLYALGQFSWDKYMNIH